MNGLLLIGILSIFGISHAEVFTAMVDMESLLHAEKEVVGVIDQYIESEMKRLKKLREVALEYKEQNKHALTETSNYLSNPVNAYLLVKRLTNNWEDLESLMRYNAADNFIRNITNQRGESGVSFPSDEDLKGAGAALLRLQDTYNLDASEIAEGKILGRKTAEPLRAIDCFELGRIAYLKQDYYHTLIWMQEALERHNREKIKTADEAEILEHLSFAMYQQGNVKRALELVKRLAKINPSHPRAVGNVKYYEDALRDAGQPVDGKAPPVSNQRVTYETDLNESNEMKRYEKLCRGEFDTTLEEERELNCYYKNDRPFLKLAPFKIEVVHRRPIIRVFRNIISDYEIDVIKSLAAPKLKRATVKGKDGNLITVNYRIAKSAWLKSEDHPVIARINARLDQMTNLDQETAELLQIANYGLGGHYEPHFDMSTRGEIDPYFDGTGNRIATVLFYMSQPEAGGATVFTRLGVGVFPTKNDCVFWHNLKKSGEGDLSTRHAACPVLAGQKWVANKWIHERGQEFRRQCGLSESDYE